MQKPSRRTHRDRMQKMVHSLREEIFSGKYAPDTFLPAEKVLADRFDVGTNSVSKALDILAEEGLIVKTRRVGSKVIKKETVHFGVHTKMNRDLDLATLLSEFHKDYPHIQINPIAITDDYRASNMTDDLLSTGRFDMILMNQIYYQNMRENDRLDMLQPLPLQSGVYPSIQDKLLEDGTSYVRLLAYSPVILCYNKEHFQEAGLLEPHSGWTWKDLLHHSDVLSKGAERYGFYFDFQNSFNRWPIILLQKILHKEKGKERKDRLSADDVMEVLKFSRTLLETASVMPGLLSSGTALTLFAEGKISMFMSTYFLLNEFKEASIPYDIAPLPHFTDPRTLLIWQGVAIYSKTSVPEAAQVFVDFLSSHKGQEIIQRNTLSIPGSGTVADLPLGAGLNAPSRYQLYREIIPTYRTISESQLSIKAIEAIHQLLQLFSSGIAGEEEVREKLKAWL
ncbi:extracellular solute-binding protein [Paenibacillus hodogayensis]|uniref:Extracellular solute-binding protein n=1 Tax=Paenibacillus hodogayensis TaxID=279208 RepID=A0ABV5W1X6_9BACL